MDKRIRHHMRNPSEFDLSRRKMLIAAAATTVTVATPTRGSAQPANGAAPTTAQPSASKVSFTVNGQVRSLNLDTRTTLLDALREHLHLTGTKKGCDHGQ